MGDQESFMHEIFGASVGVAGNELFGSKLSYSVRLSTMFEEEAAGEGIESCEDEEVEKEIIDEKRICSSTLAGDCSPGTACLTPCCQDILRDRSEHVNAADTASSQHMRIHNIFALCGNHRELSHHVVTPPTEMPRYEDLSEKKAMAMGVASKENRDPHDGRSDSQIEVYVKWEASKETAGTFITTLKVVKEATLADLRKLIEIFLAGNNQGFAFLVLWDANGAPIPKEKEAMILARKLPICNNAGHLACIRPAKGVDCPSHLPLSPIENRLLPLTPITHSTRGDGLLTKSAQNLNLVALLTPCSSLAASRT